MLKLRDVAPATFGFLMLATGISGCGSLDDLLDELHSHHPPQPTACASSEACPADSYCNVEAGVCTAPPGCTDGRACPAVCYGTCEKKPVQPAQCRSDADCRAVAFTCSACDCLALGPSDLDPVCAGPGVACFVDPCLNRVPICNAGKCQLNTAAVSCPAGEVAQQVCLQCGIAGGCAKTASCARPCKQDTDCGAEQTTCTAGLCQVIGCI